jgi:hypothetical protein
MVDPKTLNCYPVKKYSDNEIEICKQKIEFIKTRLVNIEEDNEYRVMIENILNDYKAKLYEMKHAVDWVPLFTETIY